MVVAPRAVLQFLLILHGQRLWQVGIDLGMLVPMFMRRHASALFPSIKRCSLSAWLETNTTERSKGRKSVHKWDQEGMIIRCVT
jgi:hypothetical protein